MKRKEKIKQFRNALIYWLWLSKNPDKDSTTEYVVFTQRRLGLNKRQTRRGLDEFFKYLDRRFPDDS